MIYKVHKIKRVVKNGNTLLFIVPDHPFRNCRDGVVANRYHAEVMLGRYLERDEIVVCKDGNYHNTERQNLKVKKLNNPMYSHVEKRRKADGSIDRGGTKKKYSLHCGCGCGQEIEKPYFAENHPKNGKLTAYMRLILRKEIGISKTDITNYLYYPNRLSDTRFNLIKTTIKRLWNM